MNWSLLLSGHVSRKTMGIFVFLDDGMGQSLLRGWFHQWNPRKFASFTSKWGNNKKNRNKKNKNNNKRYVELPQPEEFQCNLTPNCGASTKCWISSYPTSRRHLACLWTWSGRIPLAAPPTDSWQLCDSNGVKVFIYTWPKIRWIVLGGFILFGNSSTHRPTRYSLEEPDPVCEIPLKKPHLKSVVCTLMICGMSEGQSCIRPGCHGTNGCGAASMWPENVQIKSQWFSLRNTSFSSLLQQETLLVDGNQTSGG